MFDVALTLLMIGIGIYNIIRILMISGFCDKLLQKGDYTESKKMTQNKYDHIFSAYWMLITLIYLVASFLTLAWGITWIIWPVAGLIFGIMNVLLTKES